MADDKKLHPPQWLGRPITADEHVQDLETRAAINEFHHKMPRQQAEQHAHDSYVKEQRERAAAHHLAGMKAATAVGNHQDARKHWAMYDLHLKALGKDSIGAVPPEIEKRMMDEGGDKPLYKFKVHKGDLFALHEPSKDAAPPEGTPVQKSEAKRCKWRLGERRCQRMVSTDYCHDHVNHWANKIKQKESQVDLEKGWPKDQHENDMNRMAGPVMTDMMQEKHNAKLTVHTPENPAAKLSDEAYSQHRGESAAAEGEARAANWQQQLDQAGGSRAKAGRVPGMEPHFDFGAPASMPFKGGDFSPADKQNDAEFWQQADAESQGKTVAALRARAKARSQKKQAMPVIKADMPPAGTAHLQAPAPQLHSTVEGFMGAFKTIPKGSPARGKFITQHMNHGPFLAALQQHPQGKQLHQMLTTHLNSAQNAGFKAGATSTIVKSEQEEVFGFPPGGKKCNSCGTVHTAESWAKLPDPPKGSRMSAGDDDTHDYHLEMKNCHCGSTLATSHRTVKPHPTPGVQIVKHEKLQAIDAAKQLLKNIYDKLKGLK